MCTLSKFEEIELDKVEVTMIGDVVISEEEKSVLKLQHKFAVLSKLDPVEMETDLELGFGKGRYTPLAEIEGKRKDEEEIDDETREKMEEQEAICRQVFNPLEKTFDFKRKRTTDLKENSRVMLPKPLPTSWEAGMETRRRSHLSMFNTYKEKNCNKFGDQKTNLTEMEEKA